jgi:hypothetical protein
MAESELDTFLASGSEPAPVPEAEPAPAAVPEIKAPPGDSKPAAPAAKAPPEPEEDEEPAPARDGEAVVPRRALEDERSKRQNWVERAAKAEAERDMLNKQLEEARRATQAPPPPPQYQASGPDPSTDPVGFVQWRSREDAKERLNERLNLSELLLRKEVGDEKVDAAIHDFQEAAKQNQSLFHKLYAQPDPYGWAFKEVEKLRVMNEIGDDPAAYKAKLLAEVEAERIGAGNGNGAAHPVSPAAGLPPSLATARSVAGRSSPAWTGPPSLDQLFPSHNRKK